MTSSKPITGCGTALVTPFDSDNRIDVKALEKTVELQIKGGVDFLVPCGTTGESPTLSHDEHLDVIRIVVNKTAGRVPVVAGAGGNDTRKVVETALQCESLGADAILSVTPYYNKPTQEGLYQHFKAIADSLSIPLIPYNVPIRTSVNLLPATVARLAQLPNIIGIKEACADISQIAELAHLVPDGFSILSGNDDQIIPIMSLGGTGLIAVISNEAPRLTSQMVHACRDGKFDEARAIQRRLWPLMKLNFVETSPAPVKAAMALMGLIQENIRLPLVLVTESNRAKIREALAELDLIP
jgi:4-hydroxy-tetrahydrodipicolinate synthase